MTETEMDEADRIHSLLMTHKDFSVQERKNWASGAPRFSVGRARTSAVIFNP